MIARDGGSGSMSEEGERIVGPCRIPIGSGEAGGSSDADRKLEEMAGQRIEEDLDMHK